MGATRVLEPSNSQSTANVVLLRELESIGHQVAFGHGEPGSCIGLSSTLSCDHSCYTVEASGAAEFTFVPAPEAQELLRSRPDLCLQVIGLLGKEMSSICNERALLSAGAKPVRIQT